MEFCRSIVFKFRVNVIVEHRRTINPVCGLFKVVFTPIKNPQTFPAICSISDLLSYLFLIQSACQRIIVCQQTQYVVSSKS